MKRACQYFSGVCLCFIVLVLLSIAIDSSEAGKRRLRGKFVTQGGSKCKWVERRRRGGESYSLIVSCKCTDRQGDQSVYKYQCEYNNVEVNNATESLNKSKSEFFRSVARVVAGKFHMSNVQLGYLLLYSLVLSLYKIDACFQMGSMVVI